MIIKGCTMMKTQVEMLAKIIFIICIKINRRSNLDMVTAMRNKIRKILYRKWHILDRISSMGMLMGNCI